MRKNVLANYFSQIYVTLVGIVMVPVYLHYMGAEAYGLVGFFAMIQVWFGLLDMGLTLTLVRETARLHGKAVDALTYRSLVRALELIFAGVAVGGGVLLFAGSAIVAESWLNVQHLAVATVTDSLKFISVAVAMRWMSGLYRGIATGAEDFVWLGLFNAVIATLRFVGVIPALIFIGGTPIVFFGYQCAIGIVELVGLFAKAQRLVPGVPDNGRMKWSFKLMFSTVRRSLGFSLGISFAAIVWVMMTQVDKLMMSKLLPLTDYGVFTLSVLAASGVNLVAGPLNSALLPRLTRLHAQGDDCDLILLYKKMTRAVVVMVAPVSLLLAIFSDQVLFAWTGSHVVAAQGSAVLSLYALGNAVLAVATFPYYLQYAKGTLRLHVAGGVLFLGAFIPVLLALTQSCGAIGAGFAWLGINICYLFFWTPIVHGRFAKGHHIDWLVHDVVAPCASSVALLLALSVLTSMTGLWPQQRLAVVVALLVLAASAMTVSVMSQSEFRGPIENWLKLARTKYLNSTEDK
jgi:O-antigen/teichoic acid export membrane protein